MAQDTKKFKVLLINGSPKPAGCTARALEEVAKTLHGAGVETETVQVGAKDIRGCIACLYCRTHGKCVFNDIVNETAARLDEFDGMVVGSPVYYAGANGQLHAFLDRLFYSSASSANMAMKVGAAVVSSRRAGSTGAFDDINKYFTIAQMPVASSTYWNEVHGATAEEVEKDHEGLQTMRNLGRNIAFLIKAIRRQKDAEGLPAQERGARTNFIRE